MSEVRQPEWTLERFLAWEAAQELKWEFDGIAPVAMTGGTWNHAVIQGNIVRLLNNRFVGTGCRAVGPDIRVVTDRGMRYPDAVVTCSPPPQGSTLFCPEPVVIFEVLSPSTASDDRTTKMTEYRTLQSLRHYIMLEQDRVFATVITRAGGGWGYALLGRDGMLELPEIGIQLAVADLYDGVDLPERPLPTE